MIVLSQIKAGLLRLKLLFPTGPSVCVFILPPVINMPGALGTQARHCTEAAALGKLKVVMQHIDSESSSLMPLCMLATSR